MKKLILPVYLGLHRLMMKLCWNLFVLLPLNPQKAVFSNFNGGGYGDNPKFIAQEFLRRGLSWKLYWVSASDYNLPKGILPLRPNTIAFGKGRNLGGRYPQALLFQKTSETILYSDLAWRVGIEKGGEGL